MMAHLEPFADELLTSWIARRAHGQPIRPEPNPHIARKRNGKWRTADVLPEPEWLESWARQFKVRIEALNAVTIAHRFPNVPIDFLSWNIDPFQSVKESYQPRPRIEFGWCSKCLAQDYASACPAYFRQDWAFATKGFCEKHDWPLVDYCGLCGSSQWTFFASTHGPLRLMCRDCWRPLERACPLNVTVAKIQHSWKHVIAFERELQRATEGKMPDQFRFNNTSAKQLLAEVQDICQLLFSEPNWLQGGHSEINRFDCPDLNPWHKPYQCIVYRRPYPLATARPVLRRALLAALAAILDPRIEVTQELFGHDRGPAINTFIVAADERKLDAYLAMPGRWSPSFCQRITAIRARQSQDDRIRRGNDRVIRRLEKRLRAYQAIAAYSG